MTSPWKVYLLRIAQGSKLAAVNARLCLRIKASSPAECTRVLYQRWQHGKIDDAGFAVFTDAVTMLSKMYDAGAETHLTDVETQDWQVCGNGHRRIRHFYGSATR